MAFVVGVSLTASTGAQTAMPDPVRTAPSAADAVPAVDAVKPLVPQVVPVPSSPASYPARKVSEPAPMTAFVTASTRLPGAGSTRVSAATAGAGITTRSGVLVRAGDLPVLLTRPTTGGTTAAAVVSQSRARAAGVNGAVFTVTGLTPGGVGLDYSTFADAGGAGYGARLRLVALPACALSTPNEPGCSTRTLLPSVNDAVNQRLTVTLTAAQITELTTAGVQALRPANSTVTAAAAGMLVLAAEPGASSSIGDFAATKLAPSGSWSTSGGTGAFLWSYPIQTPAPSSGGAPSVGLSYNSQTVDGLSSTTNTQGSWAGQGFNMDPGFIERTYLPCADVPGVNPARVNKETADQVGDVCWAGEIVTFSLNGSTTSLVLNDDPGDTIPGQEWHPQNDNGETVNHIVEEDTAGAVVKESWKITTVDGTQYTFGLNSLPGRTTQPETNSVYTVPVYGATSDDRCYSATSLAASKCTHDLGWRWNLDSVTDTDGNVTAYYYDKDTNFYEGVNGRDEYIRGGNLNRIEYGMRLSAGPSVYSNQSTQQVLFTSENRCLGIVAAQLPNDPASSIDCNDPNAFDGNDPTDPDDVDHSAHWPDTPLDLKCDETGYCGTNSPTFWTAKRLAAITTGFRNTTPSTAFTTVDKYELTHAYSYNDTGEMTLETITRHGYKNDAVDTTLPPVRLGYVTKGNRVLGVNDEPQMQFSRLNRIQSETGSVNYVTYGQPTADTCAANNMPNPSTNTRLCYPVLKTNPYNWGKYTDWFNKYVVMSVRTDTGQDTRTADHLTTYLYGDSDGNGTSDQGVFWHYDDNEVVKPADRLYAQFRGYRYLTTITGDADRTRSEFPDNLVKTQTVYYVGIELPVTTTAGDTFTDEDWLAGSVLESRSYNGATTSGNLLSTQINSYTVVATTGTRDRPGLAPDPDPNANQPSDPDLHSRIVRADKTTTITQYVNTPNVGKRTVQYAYNPIGLTTQVVDSAGVATSMLAAPTTANSLTKSCTMYNYGTDPANRVRDRVAETITTETGQATACPTPGGPVTGADVRSRTQVYFDGSTTLGVVGDRGNPTMTRTAVNEPGVGYKWATVEASYDVFGRVTSSTGYADSATPSTARTTTIGYTPAGPGPVTASTTTNPLGQQSSQTMEPGRGQVLTATNTAGETTTVTYDGLGRTTQVSAPAQGSAPTVKYSYLIGEDTLAVTTETLVDTGTAPPAFTKSVVIADLLGQVIQTQTGAEGGGGNRLVSDVYYNSRGQELATFAPWYTAGPPTTVVQNNSNVDNLSTRALTFFDNAGRPTTVDMYDGRDLRSTTTTVYSGNKVTTVPPDGGTATSKIFDARGNTAISRDYVTSPTITGSTVTGGTYRDTDYTHDALGRLTRMRDLAPIGGPPGAVYATWEYGYDVAGRKTHQSDADAGDSSTVFNDTGETIATTDARGIDMHYAYDKLGRKTEERDNANTVTAQWTWDTDRVGSISSTRRITGGINYDTTYTGYNNQGLPGTTTTVIPTAETGLGGTYASTMTWTSTGLLATNTLPSLTTPNSTGGTRETITHTYSALGNATKQVGLNTYADDTTYDPLGQVSQITLGDNARTAWLSMQREPHTQRLSQISLHTRTYNPTVASLDYEYDEYGNVTKTVDTQGDGPTAPVQTTCYQNDNLGQLSMAWSANDNCAATPTGGSRGTVQGPQPFWLKYTYDDKGNRTKQQDLSPAGVSGSLDHVTDYTYSSLGGAHAHTLIKTSGYTTGAPTVKTDANYSYNATGSMTERTGATAGKKLTTTYYDDGRTKTLATPDGGTTTYIYDADGKILIRRDPVNVDVSPTTASQVRTAYIGSDQYRVVAGTAGITTTRQYTHAGMTIGQRIGNASISWMFADANNTTNISVATTPGGSIGAITRRFLDPFGVTLNPTTNGPWPNKNTYLNTPTNTYNLVDMGARLYDPSLGRFTTVDSVLTPYNPRQNNGYNYAWNNPLANPDPTGTEPRPGHQRLDPCQGALTCAGGEPQPPSTGAPEPPPAPSAADISEPEVATTESLPDRERREYCETHYCEPSYGIWGILWVFSGADGCVNGSGISQGIDCVGLLPPFKLGAGAAKAFGWLWKAVTGGRRAEHVEDATQVAKKVANTCNSFTAETLVLMSDLTQKFIKDVKIGDWVMAVDPESGAQGARRVIDLIRHGGSHTMVKVTFEDSSSINSTDNHRFWIESEREWLRAAEIVAGHKLLTPSGAPLTVKAVSASDYEVTAYNLTIEDIHTYFVGHLPVLVHNDTDCDQWAAAYTRQNGGVVRSFEMPEGRARTFLGDYRPPTTTPNSVGIPWGHHTVAIRDGKVFDQWNTAGIPIEDYKKMWDYSDYIDWTF